MSNDRAAVDNASQACAIRDALSASTETWTPSGAGSAAAVFAQAYDAGWTLQLIAFAKHTSELLGYTEEKLVDGSATAQTVAARFFEGAMHMLSQQCLPARCPRRPAVGSPPGPRADSPRRGIPRGEPEPQREALTGGFEERKNYPPMLGHRCTVN